MRDFTSRLGDLPSEDRLLTATRVDMETGKGRFWVMIKLTPTAAFVVRYVFLRNVFARFGAWMFCGL